MSENRPKVYSLLALSQSIKRLLDDRIGQQSFWLKAEIAQVKMAGSGHWYLELVQEKDGTRLAAMQAVIWKLDFEQISDRHGAEVKDLLAAGQELVLRVMIDYHPLYGLKLLIKDLDLSFVLGELEKRKRETLARLREEGLLQTQKKLSGAMVYQRVAILSSEGAAAYQDFIQHLRENEFGYRLQADLFPVPVQGQAAADLIRKTLLQIPIENYDLIAIIRGGGSSLDLDAFNDEALCRAAANFPLPIETGIGHESDWSILDFVAYKAHKTPTALADHLLDKMAAFEASLQQIAESLQHKSKDIIQLERQMILAFSEKLSLIPLSQIREHRGRVHNSAGVLVRLSADGLRTNERLLERLALQFQEKPLTFIKAKQEQLEGLQQDLNRYGQAQMERLQKDLIHLQDRLDLLKPERTLERGYSITRKDGKSIRSVTEIELEQEIETQLKDGRLRSRVLKIDTK